MSLTVLSVAFPLAPVSADSVGGAEQILYLLDRGLVERGHRSIVVACAGSRTSGELVCTPAPGRSLDAAEHRAAAARHQRAIAAVLAKTSVDVIHLHGHDFDMYLPAERGPVLATLHVPPEFLITRIADLRRPKTWVNGVSRSQDARLPRVPWLLPPIENGVDVERLPRRVRRRRFGAVLARICPEKGVHLALDAAERSGLPVVVAGTVYPYETHMRYFDDAIRPRLDRARRFIGPLRLTAKRRLLSAARVVLVPSLVDETSSLVSMEALACGTPVIALARGALPEVVQHGISGFLVPDEDEMAAAIARLHEIDEDACRAEARLRFSVGRMIDRYVERYRSIAS